MQELKENKPTARRLTNVLVQKPYATKINPKKNILGKAVTVMDFAKGLGPLLDLELLGVPTAADR